MEKRKRPSRQADSGLPDLLAGIARVEQYATHALPPTAPKHVPTAKTLADGVRALPCVGPANARKLLARFRSFRNIAAAAEAELQAPIGSKRGSELGRWLGEAAVNAAASTDVASSERAA